MIIITKAFNEQKLGLRKKKNGTYYEKHHILPKSIFPLWKDRPFNQVLLTAREHYFCHQLLTKIYPTKEMVFALWRLSHSGKHKISSREYERLRVLVGQASSELNKGHICSDEVKKHLSKIYSGSGNPMYGRSAIREMDEQTLKEYKENMSNKLSSVERTESWNDNISKSLKGHKKTDEHIEHIKTSMKNSDKCKKQIKKLADIHRGKHWFNNGKENVLAFECPNGFSEGKIQKELDEATKANVKLAQSNFGKGKHWFNNGKENFFGFDCPDGYVAGKLHKDYKKRQGSR